MIDTEKVCITAHAAERLNTRWLRTNLVSACAEIDQTKVLLHAAHALLKKCNDGPYVKNAMEETVFYDNTECDGFCLMGDIAAHLEIEDA